MHGNITNDDIDIMMEITEGITFKIVVLNNSTLIRSPMDKVPIISQNPTRDKASLSILGTS